MKHLPYCTNCAIPAEDFKEEISTCIKCGDSTVCYLHPPIELTEEDVVEIYNNIHFPEKRRVTEKNQITHYDTLKRFAEKALNYHQLNR